MEADLPPPRVQCHAANLMTLGDGALGCVWFSGTQEGVADISVWFSRLAPGSETWSAPVQLSQDPTRSEQNPILFPAPDGRLWLIHTAQRAGNQDTALVRCRISEDNGRSWGPTRDLFTQAGIFVRQPVVVLDNSDWLLPIFHCPTEPGQKWAGHDDTSAVMISSDQGASWHEVRVPESTGCVHMSIVPGRRPGELIGFFRSRWADHVYRSVSTDRGRHWTAPQPTELPNNNSSLQVARLTSGALAIVFNQSSAADATERRASLYDEIDDGDGRTEAVARGRSAFWGAPRAPMTVALSDDDGLTWPHRQHLETGDGYCMSNNSQQQLNREYSYPSIHQSADGALQIAYTVFRQRIRHLRLTEAWVRQAPAQPHA
ncbi:exo-alpha-sialidase [uncultured Aquincola sp.]|uniref:sialidase family protein n=1 Tax=uncultured Aquincola sp. TaxID=886556 RepID=UPI0032B27A32